MTSLYFDTNIGCRESKGFQWTREDEKRRSFFEILKDFFA